ncbi:MAG: fumarylacetoacetate hydrolase family protein [Acidobacteria bacterium]|nr:fumarylacetoacetate hydrolase family protein [Acidobacteriota bacterium]
MKFVVFKNNETDANYRCGALVSGTEIVDLTVLAADGELSPLGLLRCFDLDNDFLANARRELAKHELPRIAKADVRLCAPVPRPEKIICVGLNYRDHARESKMAVPESPVIFSKFANCIAGPNEPIFLPRTSAKVDYEAEMAVVVGRRAKHVRAADAMDYVFGYTNFNDVSARDFQFADGQWVRGKSCDTFAPIGEYIATADELADPHKLRIRFRLNGATLQDSNTDQLIFRIPELIEFLSASMTLVPGDIIATGTPPGVGFARTPPVFMKDGDVAEVEIEGLGILSNPVING